MSTSLGITKIAVCVKHLPDGQLHLDPTTRRLRRDGHGEINAFDAHAIEEALVLRADNEIEVVVVSMGPEQAVESLRSALALGADRAVLVCDPALVGSDLLGTSLALAEVLRREAPELVLFGQQAIDAGGSVLWAAVAEHLHLPVISQAVELSVADGAVQVKRQSEFGYDTIEAPLPAVVAVSDAINEPRFTSLRGMMAAKKKPLTLTSLAELGLDPASVGETGALTSVLAVTTPPKRENSTKIEDEGDAAQAIVDFLAARQLV